MFFQDFLQRVKQHKSKIPTFILIVIVIAVLSILSHKPFSIILKNIQKWLNTGLYYIPSITSRNIKEWSNTGFSILELLAILLAILFLVSVTILIFSRQKKQTKKSGIFVFLIFHQNMVIMLVNIFLISCMHN
jgi:hypothetical protein